jgi:hypothetical protein
MALNLLLVQKVPSLNHFQFYQQLYLTNAKEHQEPQPRHCHLLNLQQPLAIFPDQEPP